MDRGAIYYDGSKIEAFHRVMNFCVYTRREDDWSERFWQHLLESREVYREVLYYLEHHEFLDECEIEGFTVIDIFIWYMKKYHLLKSKEKNGADGDRELMSILAFDAMMRLQREPQFKQELMKELGMDH